MWIFKWLFIAIIMLAVLGFALQNQEQMVSVRILSKETQNLPLYFFLYIAFGIGFLLGLILPVINLFQLKIETRKVRKEYNKVREELNRLRNIDIEEEKNHVTAIPGPEI